MKLTRPLLLILLILGIAAGAYWASARYFRAGEVTRAEGRLSLYRSTVVDELNRI